MTATQRSRLAFLKLVVLGTVGVFVLAATGGAAVFEGAGDSHGPLLLQAPPPILLMGLGLTLVGLAVGRRYLKNSRASS